VSVVTAVTAAAATLKLGAIRRGDSDLVIHCTYVMKPSKPFTDIHSVTIGTVFLIDRLIFGTAGSDGAVTLNMHRTIEPTD